jgi:hypothetical protein
MSASAIADGIITNLNAASVLGSGGASKNYEVMELTSGCCAVVGWTGGVSTPVTFGTPAQRGWTHTIEAYIKDTGDHPAVMKNNFALVDKLIATIESDLSLQGTVQIVSEVRARRTPGEAVSLGGMTWYPMVVELDSTEFS